jgi:phytoene dehydrogenase-like protein
MSTSVETVDAVVIGSGPNGLTGACVLADAGWDVVVLEEQSTPGGAVRTEELTEPGFHSDVFSSFYPLGVASPHLRELELDIAWRRAEVVVANPLPGGRCAALYQDAERTARENGGGEAWLEWSAWWEQISAPFLKTLLGPFPPRLAAAGLARALGGPKGVLELTRLGLNTVRRHTEEEFTSEEVSMLLAGNALHADLAPEYPGSAIYAWVLVGLGQQVGFPTPEGGAGRLAEALVERLRAAGGGLRCGERVVRIEHDRTVHTATGEYIRARRAVLADTGAPQLQELLGLPPLTRFEYDPSTVKVDWSLDGPIPWEAEPARRAGTVHVADSMDHLSDWAGDLQRDRVSERPFLVMGQYAGFDPTRCPPGKEVAWAYTHIPQGAPADEVPARMEDEIERKAPGFKALIRNRHVLGPAEMESRNRNLVGGAINGGTAQLHQQLMFRPMRTEVPGVLLASSSAHPGGGVHGGAGANAAHAALRLQKAPRRLTTAGTVLTRMLRSKKTDQRSR